MEILDPLQGNKQFVVESIKVGNSDAVAVAGSPTGELYVIANSCVNLVNLKLGTYEVYAGGKSTGKREGHRLEVSLSNPLGIGVSADGTVYVTTSSDHCVYEVKDDQMTLFAGQERGYQDGPRLQALFNTPHRIDFINGEAFIPDCWNHCIRRIGRDGMVTSIAKSTVGFKAGPLSDCSIGYPRGLCVGFNNDVYVSTSGPHFVSRIDLVAETLSHIAGSQETFRDGSATDSGFKFPFDVAVHPTTGDIYVADDDNFRIRKVDSQTHNVTTLVSRSNASEQRQVQDGPLRSATAYAPTGICFTWQGDLVWTERNGKVRFIRHFAPARIITREYLPGFSAYLSNGKYATAQMQHPSLGEVHLHANILDFWGLTPDRLSAVLLSESCAKVPHTSVRLFLELLYAEMPSEPPQTEDLEKDRLAELLRISELLEIAYLANQVFSAQEAQNSILSWALRLISFQSCNEIELATIAENHVQMCANPLASRTVELTAHAVKLKSSTAEQKMRTAMENGTSSSTREILISALNKPLRSSTSAIGDNDTSGATEKPKKVKKIKTIGPLDDFMKAMKRKSFSAAYDISSSHHASEGLFSIAISENSSFGMLADEWVLAARWKYFAHLVDAGLSEIANRRVELPSEMPPGVVRLLVPYLYASKVCKGWADRLTKEESIESCRFILSNGLQFHFTVESEDGTEKPAHGFSSLISHCQSVVNATKS